MERLIEGIVLSTFLNYWGLNIYFRLVMEPHEIPNNTQYIE